MLSWLRRRWWRRALHAARARRWAEWTAIRDAAEWLTPSIGVMRHGFEWVVLVVPAARSRKYRPRGGSTVAHSFKSRYGAIHFAINKAIEPEDA